MHHTAALTLPKNVYHVQHCHSCQKVDDDRGSFYIKWWSERKLNFGKDKLKINKRKSGQRTCIILQTYLYPSHNQEALPPIKDSSSK